MYTIMNRQERTPIVEALKQYRKKRIVSFDVPGHKQGKSTKVLIDVLGEKCVQIDYNSSKPLDNATHPIGVIKEAQELMAEAFKAKEAFFMVGGTTSAVQAMIFTACKYGNKIILPRNVHKSAINALVLCGAVPIYVNPGVNKELGISLGMSVENIKKAIEKNPDAKAIFVNNPTYYGICSDLKKIVELAHKNNMLVLADEAHGTHFYFGDNLPISAMEAGADMSCVSLHKTGGSLTQSSALLINNNVNGNHVRQIINLTMTTSPSYILMSSLDIARSELAINGKEIFKTVINMADYARKEVNKIGDYYAFGEEIINNDDIYSFDNTKLCIHTRKIGLAGIEVYDKLRDEYNIQIEFGDIGNVLAIISVGDRNLELERLIAALAELKRKYKKDYTHLFDHEYINPIVKYSPQKAFYSNKHSVKLDNSIGKTSAEFVMAYPPGIPIIAPGEEITQEIITYIKYAKEKGCVMQGTEDIELNNIQVMEE